VTKPISNESTSVKTGTVSDNKRMLPRLIKALQQTSQRQLPYGLLSVRFLLPASNPRINLHRDLRLSTSNAWRLFFTVANIWLALRWLTWLAWRASNGAVHIHGLAAQNAGAQSPATQRREILRLALLHSIPPLAWYQYQLWQPSKDIWAYVYDSELPQFHQFYNGNLKGHAARLLADKWLFAQSTTAAGITATQTLAELNKGQHDALLAMLQQHASIFCKPRFGSASRGAFAATLRDGNPLIKLLKDESAQQGNSAIDTLKNLLAENDYVIQPLLVDHRTLQALSNVETNEFADVISVRVLSRHQQGHVSLFCAYLEIPLYENGRKLHALIAINSDSGALSVDGDNWHYQRLRERHPHLLAAADGVAVPYWPQIRDNATAAHRLVDEINVVAWDFIVTDEGPVLLEGNINWRVSPVQILFGPLLPRLFPR
jgi:hypothetical protein